MAQTDQRTSVETPAGVCPRSAINAILLNVLGMGAGYLYLGRPLRFAALLAWTLATLAASFHGLWGAIATPIGFVVLVGGSVLVMLVSIVDAIVIARRSRRYVLKRYNRGWIYAAPVTAWLALSMVQSVPSLGLARAVLAFRIPSGSMLPTLAIGDQLVADMTAYRRTDPQRGDVAIIRHHDGSIRIVRIIGLPGERIAIRDGSPVVNDVQAVVADQPAPDGRTVIRRETHPDGLIIEVRLDTSPGPLRVMAERPLPASRYFVLGDNRDNSADSRLPRASGGLDLVERSRILGRASFIIWTGNWNRIGSRL